MAILDLQNKLNSQNQSLDDLLAQRRAQIESGIAGTRSTIEAGRNKAFGNFQNTVAGLPIGQGAMASANAAIPSQSRQLGLSLEGMLGNQRQSMNRERINLTYNRALQKAQQAGLNRQDADAFARATMQQEIAQQNEASSNEMGRQQLQRQTDIQSAYQGQLQGFSQFTDPKAEYQQAAARMLGSIPPSLFAYYALSKNPASTTQPGTSSFQPNYQTLNERPFGDLG